ncbi:hypothetical protein GGR61_003690 [Xanthomonas arboricola]|nr:hypothetical protein [Xanthomonas sp. 3058]
MADDTLVDYRADGFECVLLVPQLRRSLWRADGNGWRLLFHQGTAFTENAAS